MPLTPKNRCEQWLQGLVDHETTLTPKNRKEEWMKGLIEGSTTLTPKNRDEEWIKEIIDAEGGGGGGLELETGTWTPDEDVATKVISFSDTHDSLPLFVMLADISTEDMSENDNIFCCIINYTAFYGPFIIGTSNKYGIMPYGYAFTGGISENSVYFSSESYMGTFLTTSSFKASTSSNNRKWKAGRTYKWIAIWKPE